MLTVVESKQNIFELVTRLDFVKAIEALNGELQTNFAVLEMVKQERREQAHLRLQKTFTFLQQSGMSLEGKAFYQPKAESLVCFGQKKKENK